MTTKVQSPSILATLGHPFAAFGAALVRLTEKAYLHSEAARCGREAGRLMMLSDAELAKLGLTREGIVDHAFRSLSVKI